MSNLNKNSNKTPRARESTKNSRARESTKNSEPKKLENNKLLQFLKEDKLDGYTWLLPNEDIWEFMSNRVKKFRNIFVVLTLIYYILLGVLWYTGTYRLNPYAGVLISVGVAFFFYKNDYWLVVNTFKKKKGEVYDSFPLWVSTLEILVMTNNIPNTFKKSIPTCPEAFKKDLIEFVKVIDTDPENKDSYRNFLARYQISDVSEVIMDMYAFNRLNKDEIVHEFKHLNMRLNEISSNIRKSRNASGLFKVSALNSVPLFTSSMYVLAISMLFN